MCTISGSHNWVTATTLWLTLSVLILYSPIQWYSLISRYWHVLSPTRSQNRCRAEVENPLKEKVVGIESKQTHRQTDIHDNTLWSWAAVVPTCTNTQTDRQTDRHTWSHQHSLKLSSCGSNVYKHTNTQTDRHTWSHQHSPKLGSCGSNVYKHTNTQTDRHTWSHQHSPKLAAAVPTCTNTQTHRHTWSHQHSPKLGSCGSNVYSINSNATLKILVIHTSRRMTAWGEVRLHTQTDHTYRIRCTFRSFAYFVSRKIKNHEIRSMHS